MKNNRSQFSHVPRAFSLMEVLLAVFILGIGLIMVATIFPVGADWTRQSNESSVAQAIAQNAVTVVQDLYGPNNPNPAYQAALAAIAAPNNVGAISPLVPLPNLTNIPVSERAYQFGNPNPFPAPNPANCTYYWTALVRVQPGSVIAPSRRYDLYILVFRKGDKSQTFPAAGTGYALCGDASDTLQPTLAVAPYNAGTYNAAVSPPIVGAVPAVGAIGIGQNSGTVFRQSVSPSFTSAVPRPAIVSGENVIYANPAYVNGPSPLIYVYQTTVSF